VISGVVLAAGEGTRFGATKQLHPVGGKPMAQHAVDALTVAGVVDLIVVTGHDADSVEAALSLPPGGRFVRNPNYREGQASSLAAALHEVDDASEAAVVLMADQPGIGAEIVQALITRFHASRAKIVRAVYLDGPGPALLSREIFAEAGHLHGDVGARVLIASHPDWVEQVPIDSDAPRDVDTPEDADRLSR
jgi:CTP:molybdopterin cytidylyltransferase MocA